MKIKILRKYNSLLVFLLSCMGFLGSCVNIGVKYGGPPAEYGVLTAEYGVPHARFVLKGTVISEKKNKHIPNIKIIQGTDTVYSDMNGKFIVEKNAALYDNVINIKLQDDDGKTNGEFQTLNMDVDFKDVPFSGGSGSWDKGEAVKEMDIKLKSK